ncbi:sodium:solute symporter [Lacimicrobium alkaliphilum]|uniref:Sodium transporter n=1 Tax=Lacimicrobium alkaliphilum TaxID=1526571 RepID=A0A0U2RN49_9ALTE|nr:sodium:solute symporter [Lacimicrobium alkaliphilum]ALS98746.1 sodium transporter [Lacimicrobium alkaliphilum]
MTDYSLGQIDIVFILIYFAVVMFIGVKVGSKHKDAQDYFLAGRSMIWPFVGISLFASNISSTTLVGLSGSAYSTGISVFNYEWMASVVLVFFAIFLLPIYLNSKIYTMPEYLERRFDVRSRYYFSGVTLIGNILIDTAGALFAGGILLKLIFPAFELWEIIFVLSIAAGIYTIVGGLKAVIYTDAIQTVLILIGAIAITVIAYNKAGGWDAIQAATDPEALSLIRPADDPSMPWTGLLFGVPVLGFYFWCTNQFMVQRVLSAKNNQHGRWGLLLAGALKLPVLFLMVFPGTIARILYPDIESPNLVYPTLIFELLPVGLKGLVVAGILAALMSSIDSTLHSASTLVTMDFVSKAKPDLTSKQLMKVGRLTAFIFMLAAAAWAPYIEKFGSLFEYLQQVLAYIAPPVVSVFILGALYKGMTANAAFYSFMLSLALSVSMLIAQGAGVVDIHFLHVAGLLFAIAMVTGIVISLIEKQPLSEDKQAYTWSPAQFRQEMQDEARLPLYQNYIFLSVVLLAVTTALVVAFA